MKPNPRYSIAGMMTLVLVISLGLAALRSGSATWAGGLYLLTYAVLLLAIVGAFCRKGPERTWWIGFALFGIAYFRWCVNLAFRGHTLPTTLLLDLIKPAGVGPYRGFDGDPFAYYWLVGHCLWSILAALIGGALSLALFAVPGAELASHDAVPARDVRPARANRYRTTAAQAARKPRDNGAPVLPGAWAVWSWIGPSS